MTASVPFRSGAALQGEGSGERIGKESEEYEKKKFAAAAEDVCKDFTRAERIMALNNPMMQFCVYAGMAFVLSYGSYEVISATGAAAGSSALDSSA